MSVSAVSELRDGVSPEETGAGPAENRGSVDMAAFAADGFAGPVRVFSEPECRLIAAHLRRADLPRPAAWGKGRAVTDPFVYALAVRPALLALLTPLLGGDIVLWGASAVRRRPGESHPWHTDIESSAPGGGFVSVWIGIENTAHESSLRLIAGSHLTGRTFQQTASERRVRRGEASPEIALEWARTYAPRARLVQPDVRDGEALLFDGRLWHGSHNGARGERTALLLQYAAAGLAVRMPDFSNLEWPFRFREEPRPPVIAVQGHGRPDVNRVVPPPGACTVHEAARVHQLDLPLAEDPRRGWKPHPVFHRRTPLVDDVSCHASVLTPGHSPHPPHVHPEEELLVVLDGRADVVLADDADGKGTRVEALEPGSFAYYPAGQHHTIRNSASAPVTYVMFKWRNAALNAVAPLPTTVVRPEPLPVPGGARFSKSAALLEGATAYVRRLHAHASAVGPGGGYEPHADEHDVALLVFSGAIQTLDRTVKRGGIVYCPAGTRHGLRGGPEGATYLVLEFHAPGGRRTAADRVGRRLRTLWWRAASTAARILRLAGRIRRRLAPLR